MADLEFYKINLGINTLDDLEQSICNSLVETNCTYSFFVDWQKVIRNRDSFRNELALLSSLKGMVNPKTQLRTLICKYPEIVRVLPLLLAVRDDTIKVLHALKPKYQYLIYDFKGGTYSESDIDLLVEFCDRTGLLNTLVSINSPLDYMTGVEVGLDSNARKNRSGDFMENAVSDILNVIMLSNPDILRFSQKTFKHLKKQFDIPIPDGLKERKFDELIVKGNIGINIEVNFYGGTGSKPSEIVESYISRKKELDSIGWRFIWITDGPGWNKMRNQLRRGISNFEYTLNLDMLEKGLLQKIILI
jgi:type II restriction enzyme